MLLFQQNPAAWDITFSPFAGGGKGTWGPCMSLHLLSIYLIFTPPTVIPAGNPNISTEHELGNQVSWFGSQNHHPSIYLVFTPPTVIPAGNSTYQGK
jgi:hypothetical protein